ncbi:methionyl-tRNA formyltransferase [Patescibacteria group bacterium]|nr:methionyl-tRNA formyltransferase [Patescibacteria group bacterium]
MNIIFFGSGDYVISIVDVLKKHGLNLVVTTEREGKFLDYLKNSGLPYLISNLKSQEDIDFILGKKLEVGVLASFGAIIPKDLIEKIKLGILNIHPSLLPKYKGPSPIQETILNGETKTGTTIIKLDEKVDHGPVVAQKEFELTGNETAEDLKRDLFKLGAEMTDKVLQEFEIRSEINAKPQDHTKETFTKKVTRESGFVDVNNPPGPEILNRMVRAYFSWPGVWTEYDFGGKKRRVKLLPENKLQVEGGKPMSYKDFVNGFGQEAREFLLKLQISNY